MKKTILLLLFCAVILLACTKTFKADTNLVKQNTRDREDDFYAQNLRGARPFLAVYQKAGRTLALVGADHGPKSLSAVNYAFNEYYPQIALIEREPGFPLQDCRKHEDAYTAALSAKNNIPLVRMDADYGKQWQYAKAHGFSYEDFQMFMIIKHAGGIARHESTQPTAARMIEDYQQRVHNPAWGELFTRERLLAYFKEHYNGDFDTTDFRQLSQDVEKSPAPWAKKTPFYKIMYGQPDGRSIFMLQNIEAALNEYPVVFGEMGSSHFVDIYEALEKMMGKPHYIPFEQIPPQQLWQECSHTGVQEKILVP